MNEFGILLRKERKGRGLSLRELADVLLISVPYLSDVERGNRRPFDQGRIGLIAKTLRCKKADLYQAALKSKDVFELDALTISDRQRIVGAALVKSWASLSSSQIRAIEKTLGIDTKIHL